LLLVNVFSRQRDLKISKKSVRALVEGVLKLERSSHQEVSIYFVTQSKICELHEEFFQDPSPTDCISFPIDEAHLGEVFVCPKAALSYAKPYEELSLYVIHGLLHCLGFDDLEPAARRMMRKKEKHCMAKVKTRITP
jgi:probable rRNA maturation factor